MTSIRPKLAAVLAAGCLILGSAASGLAQDKPVEKPKETRDEGLERLLDKIDESKAKPDAEKDKDKDKSDKPKGSLSPKDQDLDKLLEGLGESKDKPSPDDKKPGGGGGQPSDPKPGQGGDLKPEDQLIDDILKPKSGEKTKKKSDDKKGQGQGQEGEGGGPLGDVVKQMRDVEERLGKTDTGEETRKRQGEIVKKLDTLIEQMKNSPSQSKGLKMLREGGKKPGPPQPGQPGNQPGAMANGVNKSNPEKPKTPSRPITLAKEVWGLLPDQFRGDIDNVLNEQALESKAELVRLYFLSLGKKNSNAQE